MPNSIMRTLVSPFLGKRRLQPVFEALYKLSLAGMNVGQGGMPAQSGEDWVIRFVRTLTDGSPAPPVVLDVGANVGQFAGTILEAFGSRVDIWCFEPAPATFARLAANIGSRPNVRLINSAVGSAVGKVTMYSPYEASKLASLYNRSNTWSEDVRSESVECTTLDAHCAAKGLKGIDFLKIDVEGHELAVLQGASGLLQADGIRLIQFEFSAAHIDSRTYFRDFYNLLSPKFEIHRVLQNGLRRIDAYDPSQELFKRATNFLAIRRGATK